MKTTEGLEWTVEANSIPGELQVEADVRCPISYLTLTRDDLKAMLEAVEEGLTPEYWEEYDKEKFPRE